MINQYYLRFVDLSKDELFPTGYREIEKTNRMRYGLIVHREDSEECGLAGIIRTDKHINARFQIADLCPEGRTYVWIVVSRYRKQIEWF